MRTVQNTLWGRVKWLLTGRAFSADPNDEAVWSTLTSSLDTASGVNVTEQSALGYAPVLAAVRILAESVAMLPLHLYETVDDGRRRAKEHPLYHLLRDAPNAEMSAFEFREALMGHLLTWGNAYAEIDWSPNGFPRALWPLRPDRTRVIREGGRLFYRVMLPTGGHKDLPNHRVFHVRGLGYSGLVGYSPIQLMAESIGLGQAAQEYGSRLFKNGARPGVILKWPGRLSPKAKENLRASWEKTHGGLSNAHRLSILEEGLDVASTVGFPPEAAQFLQTRAFQVQEIARGYRIPLHMLADITNASYASVEQFSLEFVLYSLAPWLVRWEQATQRALLLPSERGRFFTEFLVDALLRGDIKTRYEAYAIARQWGWMSADDIRDRENMNRLPEGQGEAYLTPLNMIPSSEVRQSEDVESPKTSAQVERSEPRGLLPEPREVRAESVAVRRSRLAGAFRPTFVDAGLRVVRRERADILRQAKKLLARGGVEVLENWIREFYEKHPSFVEKAFRPAARSLAEGFRADAEDEVGKEVPASDIRAFVDEYTSRLAMRWIRSSIGQILEITAEAKGRSVGAGTETRQFTAEELEGALEDRFDEWEEGRPDKEAARETIQLGNAIVWTVFGLAGVQTMRWSTIGKNCPMCSGLAGSIVGIDESFASAGQVINHPNLTAPFTVPHTKRHPPLHRGCDCFITAG